MKKLVMMVLGAACLVFGAAEAALPPGYDAVEYIESTPGGGQYIDTEYTHKTTTRIVCELNVNSDNSSDTWHFAFGARAAAWHESDSRCLAFLAVDYGASAKVGYDRSLYEKMSDPNQFPYNTRVTVTSGGLDLSWSSSGQPLKTLHVDGGNDDGDRSLYVFALHNADKWAGTLHHTAMKLYSFKIYEGDVLKRDFVPCVDASGVAGLYDQVEGKFHTNAGGGSFNAGSVAVSYWEPVAQVVGSAFCEIVTKDTTKLENGKWYAVVDSVERGAITVEGSANLILCDGAKLSVEGDDENAGVVVEEGRALTIYGQTVGTGELAAKGGRLGAGIGGSYCKACGTVSINGGRVGALGGFHAAGIGGGHYGAGGTVTINGGTVMANGGDSGAGIGGGSSRAGGTVTINGGSVTATGGYEGAGIGGGYHDAGGTVTINGGTVSAMGGKHGAGIGGGLFGAGGTVTINGGSVTATGGWDGAGIGGGSEGAGGTVTVNGGAVTAQGDGAGAGIGNGWKGKVDSGKTKISGGTVVAKSGTTWTVHPFGNSTVIDGGSVRAVNYNGDPAVDDGKGGKVHCVTVKCPGLSDAGGGLRIEGLGDYGVNDIRAIDDELYLWLPVGRHSFKVGDGKTTHSYFATVSGREQAVTVKPLTEAVRVNGSDIFAVSSGAGWEYDFMQRVLTLTGGTDYVITGVSTGDLVRIKVTADANVMLSNATIQVSSGAAITVEGDHTLRLSAGIGENAAYLLGEGQMNAILGGNTVIDGGFVCLWSEGAIPVNCGDGKFSVAQSEIMCVGADADRLSYVESYGKNDSDRILLVGPRCRLEGPSVGNATVEVWSQPECLGSRKDGAWSCDLMLGDTAIVRVIPAAGYVLRGAPAEQYFEIDGDRTLEPSELPVALMGLLVDYRAATVEATGVKYQTQRADAVLLDEVTNRLETVGKGEYGEEWYVVTGQLDCASICVTTGLVNLILYPGAILSLQGEDGQPGLGVMPNTCLNIYGCEDGVGTLVAFGGTYAAGIGGGGSWIMDDVPEADAGWITVNGGEVIAIGGNFGAGIGGGACGAGAYLEVNGGSVLAYGGYDAEDIGGGSYGEDGVTVVNGGTVMANSVEAKPVNAAGTKLYRVYAVSENFIPTNDVPLSVRGLGGFGTADVFANEDGAVCFYLPNGHYEFTVDGWKCVADVQDGTASAEVGERSEERGGESEENEGEGEEVTYAKVQGIEVGKKVKVTVRTKVDWTYRLRRVTFVGGKMVEGDVVWFATADGDTLTLRDDEPPTGSGFYVVEESEW